MTLDISNYEFYSINNQSMKYQRFTPSGFNEIWIRKFEFVTKIQFTKLFSGLKNGLDIWRDMNAGGTRYGWRRIKRETLRSLLLRSTDLQTTRSEVTFIPNIVKLLG